MKKTFQNHFGTNGFSKNDEFYNQEDIVDQSERIEDYIDTELTYFSDRNPNRVFLGGITNGASMAIATFLRSKRDKHFGGIMSLYGINPIKDSLLSRSVSLDKLRSETPMLMFNNKYLLNDEDI